jgi:hypothetical protein
MRVALTLASVLAAVTFAQPATAQQSSVMFVPVGGGTTKPVPQHPVDPKDSPEEIAKDAQRDLRDNRFYNKPGATRAQYDSDWQECRLIARGSRTPAGTVPVVYNGAVSPIAAGAGGLIGGLLVGAMVEGELRRQNRKTCLLIRGWRMVELPPDAAQRVSAMSEADRNDYFNQIVGADHIDGEITERTNFSLPVETLGNVDSGISGPESLFIGKKIDAWVPVTLAPDEAAVVLAYRRPGELNAGRFVQMDVNRYDAQAQDLIYQPRDWKKKGDKTTYYVEVPSGDRKAGLEVQLLKLTPGDYVITSTSFARVAMSSNCFGAPTFHVGAGDVAYIGDFIPVWGARGADGKKQFGVGYASRIEDARRVLATKQPQLAAAMKAGKVMNGATYACSAITMDRWDINGAENVPALATTASTAQ